MARLEVQFDFRILCLRNIVIAWSLGGEPLSIRGRYECQQSVSKATMFDRIFNNGIFLIRRHQVVLSMSCIIQKSPSNLDTIYAMTIRDGVAGK